MTLTKKYKVWCKYNSSKYLYEKIFLRLVTLTQSKMYLIHEFKTDLLFDCQAYCSRDYILNVVNKYSTNNSPGGTICLVSNATGDSVFMSSKMTNMVSTVTPTNNVKVEESR